MENMVKKLAKLSEEFISVGIQINQLETMRKIMAGTRRTSVNLPLLDDLLKSLRETQAYIHLEASVIVDELNLKSVLPRVTFSTTELKDGYVEISSKDTSTVVLPLSDYADKTCTLKSGQIAEIAKSKHYVLDRLQTALSQDGALLKYKAILHHCK